MPTQTGPILTDPDQKATMATGNESIEHHQSNEVLPDQQAHGIVAIGAIKRIWNVQSIWFMWIGAFLLAFTISYDQQTYATYQTYAASEFGHVSLLSTIAVVQSVISVMQLPLSKLADAYGRLPMIFICVLIMTIGEILLSSAKNMQQFAGAQVFFTFGLVGLHLLLVVLAGDSSDLRNRAIMNFVPYFPGLITAWTASYVTSSVLKDTTWRWGYGVFAIIIPIVSIPLIATLFYNQRKARKLHVMEPNSGRTFKEHLSIIQTLDPLGLLLLIAGLTLLLVPITLASDGLSGWKGAKIIAMLVIGVVCLIIFTIWEARFSKWPIVAFKLFKGPTIPFSIIAALCDYISWYVTATYIYNYLVVARDLSVRAATNVNVIIPFMAVLGQIGSGVIVKYVGRYKWVVVTGAAIKVLGMGLMLRYYTAKSSLGALVVSLVLQGTGEGTLLTLITGMQASAGEHQLASIIGLFITSCGVGGAVGSAIAGGIWTNTLLKKLEKNLPATLLPEIAEIYGSVTAAREFKWGSAARDAINLSYDQTLRYVIITGLVLAIVEFLATLMVKDLNLKVIDKTRNYEGMVIGKTHEMKANQSNKAVPSEHTTEQSIAE